MFCSIHLNHSNVASVAIWLQGHICKHFHKGVLLPYPVKNIVKSAHVCLKSFFPLYKASLSLPPDQQEGIYACLLYPRVEHYIFCQMYWAHRGSRGQNTFQHSSDFNNLVTGFPTGRPLGTGDLPPSRTTVWGAIRIGSTSCESRTLPDIELSWETEPSQV